MGADKHAGIVTTLSWKNALGLIAVGALSFQLAYDVPACACLVLVYLGSLYELTRLKTTRRAFYFGLLEAVLCFAPKLSFMWTIFGPAAIPLWLILSFWIGLFVVLGRAIRIRFGAVTASLLIPCAWTGLEYFRSELYYLRFSWLNEGYLFGPHLARLPISLLGMYGMGFILFAMCSLTALLPRPRRILLQAGSLLLILVVSILPDATTPPERSKDLRIAGVQMEFPSETEVMINLGKAIKVCPDAQIIVLSEYTFDGPVPEKVRAWCQKNKRYLIAGGKDFVQDHQYYNTAFVIGTNGEVVFQQAKSVPIQFFKDGLPAPGQKLWDSPWGRIGICICYDLSYSRVTDRLVRLGAQAIIVPTMDVVDWGKLQHRLHAMVAPVRAAEYRIPIFRVASSGISQSVDWNGSLVASAPFAGDGAIISSTLAMARPGRLPLDRILAPVCTGVTLATFIWLIFQNWKIKRNLSTALEKT